MNDRTRRKDGGYTPARARSRLKRAHRLLSELDPGDCSRQDSDNFDVVIRLLTTIYIRQQRRAEVREEQV